MNKISGEKVTFQKRSGKVTVKKCSCIEWEIRNLVEGFKWNFGETFNLAVHLNRVYVPLVAVYYQSDY